MLENKEKFPAELQAAIEQLQDNMLVALVKRAGGFIEFSVEEIDEAAERIVLESDPVNQKFTIKLEPKREGH